MPPKKLKFRRYLGAPRRYVRRRGFGIHSPFAFDFVLRVISQPCRYYCYPRLDEAARQAGMKRKVLRLIFRVALFFRPQSVEVIGSSQAVETAVGEAVPAGEGRGPRMIVVTAAPDSSQAEKIGKCMSQGAIVVFTGLRHHRDAVAGLWSSADRGMLFRGSDTAVYVGLCHLPRQQFNVWI